METERPGVSPTPWDDGSLDLWQDGLHTDPSHSLVELINRVLDRGVVITGHVTLSVAGVDLVYLGVNAVLTSVSTAREQLGRQVGTGSADPGPEPV